MADSESCPVGTDQTVLEDGVFNMSTVGAMNTNGQESIVSEASHVPRDNFVYLVASQSENELSFVPSQTVTSRLDNGLSPRLVGAHCSDHVLRQPHMGALYAGSSWRMDNGMERQVYRSTLEMEVAETKQMLSQQQMTLSKLSDTLESLQSNMGRRNDPAPEDANQACPTSGSSSGVEVNKAKVNSKSPEKYVSSFFSPDSDEDSDESDEDDEEDDEMDEPPSKQAKLDESVSENRPTDGKSKVAKLDKLFVDNTQQGEKVNDSLAKSVNRGISSNFSIKSALEFAEIYKSPENCEFLRVPKLNEELFFEDSIASRFKKNDSVLQKTQSLLTKGMIPLVKMMNKLMEKEDDNSDIFDLATDSLQLLAYTHRDISNVRRKFLKPAVAKKYKRLCSSNVSLTSCLLGDDLEKQLKSINEHKKIGAQMTTENPRKRSYDRDYRDYQQPSTSKSDHGSRNRDQAFLYRNRGNNPRHKKGRGSQNSQNNNNNRRSK